jgi:hypothetical protein
MWSPMFPLCVGQAARRGQAHTFSPAMATRCSRLCGCSRDARLPLSPADRAVLSDLRRFLLTADAHRRTESAFTMFVLDLTSFAADIGVTPWRLAWLLSFAEGSMYTYHRNLVRYAVTMHGAHALATVLDLGVCPNVLRHWVRSMGFVYCNQDVLVINSLDLYCLPQCDAMHLLLHAAGYYSWVEVKQSQYETMLRRWRRWHSSAAVARRTWLAAHVGVSGVTSVRDPAGTAAWGGRAAPAPVA